MDNYSQLLAFIWAVEHGNFSAAARAHEMTPSTVSKLISRLEDRLQVRLFQRGTRSLTLTEEDKERQEEIEARNRLDSLVYGTEKTLRDNRDKLSEPDVKPVEDALAAAKKALEDGGKAGLESAAQELTRVSHKLAEVLYQQASAASPEGGPAPGASEPKPQADVVDAEVVDDGKK